MNFSASEPPPPELDNQFLSGIRLLLVEDYLINVKMALRFLHRWGVVVETAENGLIACEKCRNEPFDIILMDLEMPVMDGYTATAEIRTFNPAIPIIALTASETFSDVSKTLEVGMNDYVSKPFVPHVLYTKIALHCRP